jgi:hypothetical protein
VYTEDLFVNLKTALSGTCRAVGSWHSYRHCQAPPSPPRRIHGALWATQFRLGKTMNNRIAILGSLFLLILGCITKTTEDLLVGHWHILPPYKSEYKTIDIEDTVTTIDKYDLLGGRLKYKRLDENGIPILPTYYFEHSTTFNLSCDTLIIRDSFQCYKYLKSDPKTCVILDRYASSYVDIRLDDSKASDSYEASQKHLCSDDLFIGRLRHNSAFFDSLSRTFPDSIFIQVNDVLINFKHIPSWCKHVSDKCNNSENQLNINLHADIDVPDNFIKQLESRVPEIFSLHRVVNGDDHDIGLKKIR